DYGELAWSSYENRTASVSVLCRPVAARSRKVRGNEHHLRCVNCDEVNFAGRACRNACVRQNWLGFNFPFESCTPEPPRIRLPRRIRERFQPPGLFLVPANTSWRLAVTKIFRVLLLSMLGLLTEQWSLAQATSASQAQQPMALNQAISEALDKNLD